MPPDDRALLIRKGEPGLVQVLLHQVAYGSLVRSVAQNYPFETVGLLIGTLEGSGESQIATVRDVQSIRGSASSREFSSLIGETQRGKTRRGEEAVPIGWFYAEPGLNSSPPRLDLKDLYSRLSAAGPVFLLYNPFPNEGAFFVWASDGPIPLGGFFEVLPDRTASSIVPWSGTIGGLHSALASVMSEGAGPVNTLPTGNPEEREEQAAFGSPSVDDRLNESVPDRMVDSADLPASDHRTGPFAPPGSDSVGGTTGTDEHAVAGANSPTPAQVEAGPAPSGAAPDANLGRPAEAAPGSQLAAGEQPQPFLTPSSNASEASPPVAVDSPGPQSPDLPTSNSPHGTLVPAAAPSRVAAWATPDQAPAQAVQTVTTAVPLTDERQGTRPVLQPIVVVLLVLVGLLAGLVIGLFIGLQRPVVVSSLVQGSGSGQVVSQASATSTAFELPSTASSQIAATSTAVSETLALEVTPTVGPATIPTAAPNSTEAATPVGATSLVASPAPPTSAPPISPPSALVPPTLGARTPQPPTHAAPPGNPTAVAPVARLSPTSVPVIPPSPTHAVIDAEALRRKVAAAEAALQTGDFQVEASIGPTTRATAHLVFDLGGPGRPPRLHMLSSYQGGQDTQTSERIIIGNQAWVRQGTATWTPYTETEGVWGEVSSYLPHAAQAANVQLHANGSAAELRWSVPGQGTPVALTVDASTGVPKQLQQAGAGATQATTVTYSGWNTPVDIRPPGP